MFLPITFCIYFYLNHINLTAGGKYFLILASLVFYSWWNIAYLPIILVSIAFNYIIGILVAKKENESKPYAKLILTFGVVSNLALLGYFKYSDFFIESINLITSSNIELLNLALPLAISFFTFQQIAYLVDSYRQKARVNNFPSYVLFVTFFPQLIAGPIVHHKEMMPQFARKKSDIINYQNIVMGLFLLSIGLFKKIVIADQFAIWATAGHDTANTLSLIEAWCTSLSFTFQLYFDFSAYSDMALGLGLLFNIKLPINFNSPLKATSLIEFWSRWHMTLTRFAEKYVFKTMVKSFNTYSFSKAMLSVFITLMVIAIWHDANWLFLIFGLIHGIGVVINHVWKKKIRIKINRYIAWFLTFNTLNISTIFSRSHELKDAIKVLSSMFSLDNIVLPNMLSSYLGFLDKYGVTFTEFLANINGGQSTLIWLLLGFIIILLFKNSSQMAAEIKINHKTAVFSGVVFILSLLSLTQASEFIYFEF
ncbi:MBOAT family O-acyltransferase [Candidatus Thioglobus sp.]|uniref:MBOAT family O-acyltransferase n=1 Tax=Candidatus Thioglobus sp. TaxID=2026721 RepID=UPI003D137671